MNRTRASKTWLLFLLVAGTATLLSMPSVSRAAEAGVVEVRGITLEDQVDVNLESDLGQSAAIPVPGLSGTRGWPVRKVLLYVQSSTNAIDVASFDKDPTISQPGTSPGTYYVSRKRVASSQYDTQLPIFFVEDGVTKMWVKDRSDPFQYTDRNPQIDLPKSSTKLDVTISPRRSIRIKAGETATFEAKVHNAGGKRVSLSWLVNNSPKSSDEPDRFSYRFTKEGTYKVAVLASAPDAAQDVATVTVYVGKAPEPKKKKKKDDGGTPSTNDDGGYVPGYDDGYGGYGGYGGGTGSVTDAPGPASPAPATKPDEPKEPDQPPFDDGLETVKGQLVDPAQISAVPSAETPTGSSEQAEPVEDDQKGGGGISKGAMTAVGIGVLLGLGGLAEAGAFTGFGRFRFRP